MADLKADHYQAMYEGQVDAVPMIPGLELRFRNLTLSTPVKGKKSKSSKNTTQGTKNILNNVSGVFKPGSMTLVLGQPGAGKSALLRILSGRLPLSKTLTLDGEITYNGVSRDELLQSKRMPQFVSYVAQRDQHFPTLTVKETLEFAQQCCGVGLGADVVTQQLGLELCQDTVIGDGMLRGVSGGERKRVTMGEMEFGNNLVAFMDEISTGLDSAATFDIVTTQRNLAKTTGKTIVMALLQPGPEVFELFDDVMLLAEGHVLYHGPRDDVVRYFQSLGLECPRDRDVADFLIDIGTPKQLQYMRNSASNSYVEAAMTPVELGTTFRESTTFHFMLTRINTPMGHALVQNLERRLTSAPEFQLGFWSSTAQLLQREVRTSWRNNGVPHRPICVDGHCRSHRSHALLQHRSQAGAGRAGRADFCDPVRRAHAASTLTDIRRGALYLLQAARRQLLPHVIVRDCRCAEPDAARIA